MKAKVTRGVAPPMSTQAAAMFLAAQRLVERADTYGAKHYYFGVRDAFDAVFRASARLDDGLDSAVAAHEIMAELPYDEAEQRVEEVELLLQSNRAVTIADVVQAV